MRTTNEIIRDIQAHKKSLFELEAELVRVGRLEHMERQSEANWRYYRERASGLNDADARS